MGEPRSEETKAKIALSLLGKRHSAERCEANRLGQIGKHHTIESKKKISDSVKIAMHQPEIRQKHLKALAENVAYYGLNYNGGQGQLPNELEQYYIDLLIPLGYIQGYFIHWDRSTYRPDFVHLESKTIIEIDGSSHIGREEKDKLKDERLHLLGWRVVRINHARD